MMSVAQFITFLATAGVFAFIPGPAMLYAAAQTMAGGRRSGLMASLGLHLGGYAHIAAAAFGLSVLLAGVPVLYMGVKLCGAIYLVWLGISLFRSSSREGGAVELSPGSGSFLQSLTVEMLNPKTAMFYLAFLPQFISPDASVPVPLQFIILGTIVNLMFSAADLVAVMLAGLVMNRLRKSSSVQRWLQRIGGAVLVGLGVQLAVQRG
ncbi:LysE family translocator [Aestuariivirga sp.]|uniref:LysE family translocator n=1 Tax=Aestuariivirga sp. TaxID=2650926 RepID=UPI00359425FF